MNERDEIISYLADEIVDLLESRYRLYQVYRPAIDGTIRAHMRNNDIEILTVCRIIKVIAAIFGRPGLVARAQSLEDLVDGEMTTNNEL